MPIKSGSRTDITRPDVGVVVVEEWTVAQPEDQRATAEATAAEWGRGPWPAGLLSRSCLVGTDGVTLLSYAQWTDGEAHRAFMRTTASIGARGNGEVAAGVVRPEPMAYRLYRSAVSEGSRVPGCVVVIAVETDGPARQREWVDAVFDALSAETDPPPGGLSGHFHISTDGTRVLNYAEWIDEESHRRAVADGRRGPASAARSEWYRVQNMSGVRFLGFKRYHFQLCVARPSP